MTARESRVPARPGPPASRGERSPVRRLGRPVQGGAAQAPSAAADVKARDPRLFVGSIEKAMAVLEVFETAGQPLSMSDVVARTEIGRSAVQRFLYTLHHLDYLDRDPATKRYALGHKVLRLYRGFVGGRSTLERARHAMLELNRETRECTSWVELLKQEIVIVENLPSPQITAVTLAPGLRFEALSASSGQVLMAHAPAETVERIFAASSPLARERAGAEDIGGLRRILDRVRAQGYALTTKAFDQESLSISAPVFDARRIAVGAINLSTLRSRFDRKEAMADLVPAVLAAARRASADGSL
ncbi:IclR family transcriptional regulator [Muricoccus radiodurans]|uniref:IclR family transcriptional regulator n=1 Tax=Muricoccus radiodurans TaxID=2231721 RepID=UPI003CF10864